MLQATGTRVNAMKIANDLLAAELQEMHESQASSIARDAVPPGGQEPGPHEIDQMVRLDTQEMTSMVAADHAAQNASG
jgi:hypothetical protein